MAMSTCLEPHGVNRTIHFRFTQQNSDLLVQGCICRQISDFKTLSFRMRQANRINVANNDDSRP
ncbi:hypothetical protein D3C85_1837810 [compost metagenome]